MLARADARAARTTRVQLHHEAARADAPGAQQREREHGEAPRHLGSGKLKEIENGSQLARALADQLLSICPR